MTPIGDLTGQRNAISRHMIEMMEASEFAGIPFNDIAANVHITLAPNLLASAPVIFACPSPAHARAWVEAFLNKQHEPRRGSAKLEEET